MAESLTRRSARSPEERRSVHRAEYERRTRNRRPGLTARQAAGHPRRDDRLPRVSAYLAAPARIVLVTVSRSDVRRIGRHAQLMRQLAAGRTSAAAFELRVGRWRPIQVLQPEDERGERFLLSDPDAVIALIEVARATEAEAFCYESGRAR